MCHAQVKRRIGPILLELLSFKPESENENNCFQIFVRNAQSPNIQLKVAELDNELIIQRPKPDVKDHLENNKLMRVEPSASYTRVQNGAAERSGGVLKDEIRTITIGANFSNEPLVRVRQLTFIIERPIQVEVARSLSLTFKDICSCGESTVATSTSKRRLNPDTIVGYDLLLNTFWNLES